MNLVPAIYSEGPASPAHEAAAPRQEGPGRLDPAWVISVVRRRLGLALLVAIPIFVLATAFSLLQPRTYTATADIMIDPRQEKVSSVEAVVPGLPADAAIVDTEVGVLKSRQLSDRVATALNLDRDPDFNPALRRPSLRSSLAQRLRSLLGNSSGAGSLAVRAPIEHAAVVDSVASGLSVRRNGLTYLINLSYTSTNPVKAARVANAFADLYLQGQLQAKARATQAANTWLRRKVDELRDQVQSADAAIEQYKIAHNLMSASGATLTEQEISTYNEQVATAQADLAERQARLATAQQARTRGSNGEDLSEALDSEVIRNLRTQRAVVSGRLADLEGRYGPKHPDMLKAQRELRDIDAQIRAETSRILSNLSNQAQIARQRKAAVESSLGAARGALAASNEASVKLRELERDGDAVRTLYESYLNRLKETSSQLEQPDAKIVSLAQVPPRPSSPNITLDLLLAAILAGGCGLLTLIAAEILDTTFATGLAVKRRLQVPYVAGIPLLSSVGPARRSPVEYVVDKPLSGFSEAFRNLWASVQQSRIDQPVKVIAITSAFPGEGKTTTCLCLARAIAIQGQSVIVVDCDLRRHAVDKMSGRRSIGLVEVLSGKVSLEQALVADTRTSAFLLPLSDAEVTAQQLFDDERLKRLLGELRRRFDVVILDTAPVLAIADTRFLAPKADAVVLMATWRRTPQRAIDDALGLLRSSGAHVAGVGLTQINMKQQARSGYGDPGYYYKRYQLYYAG